MNSELSYKYFFSWKFILSISISIIFSFYAFKKFDPVRFFHVLKSANYLYVFLAILLLIFVVYIRSLRWALLFKDEKISVKVKNTNENHVRLEHKLHHITLVNERVCLHGCGNLMM